MESGEWKPPVFNVKKWILIVAILIDICVILYNGIVITKNMITGKDSFSIRTFGSLVFFFLLRLIFVYGILKESLCLASSYCTFILIGIVMAIVEASDSPEEDGVSVLAPTEPTWWLNLLWIVFTTIVALLYVIDLMRIQRISRLKSRAAGTAASLTTTSSP